MVDEIAVGQKGQIFQLYNEGDSLSSIAKRQEVIFFHKEVGLKTIRFIERARH